MSNPQIPPDSPLERELGLFHAFLTRLKAAGVSIPSSEPQLIWMADEATETTTVILATHVETCRGASVPETIENLRRRLEQKLLPPVDPSDSL